ncbi:RnfABCDGE type electron transport complex subunit G [Stutzerimonas urumqiensis]
MKRGGAVVALIALLGAAMVAALYQVSRPMIEQRRDLAAERRLLDLLPPSLYDNRPLQAPVVLPADARLGTSGTEPAYLAMRDGQPSAVLLPVHAKGYEGPIHLLVAIAPDGRLLASKALAQQETPGLAALDEAGPRHWMRQLAGQRIEDGPAAWTLRTDGGEIDAIAGATITSRAVLQAIEGALMFFDAERATLLEPRP